MKNKKFKVGDILFSADVWTDGTFELYEVEIISFNVNEGDEENGLNVKCEILSDGDDNGAVLTTHTDYLFEEKKEALEFIISSIKETSKHVQKELEKAQAALKEEEERIERQRVIEVFASCTRAKLKTILKLAEQTCNDPLFGYMFTDVQEDSDFINSLDTLMIVLSENLKKRNEGAEKLLKEIFGEGE